MGIFSAIFGRSGGRGNRGRDAVVLPLGDRDALRFHDMFSGVLITGASGSAKTTASASRLLLGLAKLPHISFYVNCVKPGEGQRMEALFRHAGVSQPVLRVTPASAFGFDPLTFEMQSGSAQSAARMISAVLEMEQRSKGRGNHGDPFWMDYATRFLEIAIGATFLAEGRTSIRAVQRFILELPASEEEAGSDRWRESFTATALRRAEHRPLTAMQQAEHQSYLDFVFIEWPRTPAKTRNSCLPMIQNILARLTTGPVGAFTSHTNLSPALWTRRPCILIHDYPVLTDPVAHRAVQTMTYMATVQECLRRSPSDAYPPVCFWQDEYSYLAVPDYDYRVQSVFREAGCAAVRIVQDFQLLRKSLGGGDQGTMEADSIISNISTWICHANGDPATNQAVSDRIGKVPVRMRSGSINLNGFNLFDYTFGGAKPTVNSGWSEVMDYHFRPEFFVTFKKGAKANGYLADALILTQGNPFHNGQNFLLTQFQQVLL